MGRHVLAATLMVVFLSGCEFLVFSNKRSSGEAQAEQGQEAGPIVDDAPVESTVIPTYGELNLHQLTPSLESVVFTTEDPSENIRVYHSIQTPDGNDIYEIGDESPNLTFSDVAFVGFPDERTFVFVGDETLYRVDLVTQETKAITAASLRVGKTILGQEGFLYFIEEANESLNRILYSNAPNDVERIDGAATPEQVLYFDLNPSQEKLVYFTNDSTFVVEPDGLNRIVLMNDRNVEFNLNFSPDGNYVALTRSTLGEFEVERRLFVSDLRDGTLTQVSSEPADLTGGMDIGAQVEFSSDSQRIFFLHDDNASFADSKLELYANTIEGGNLVKISDLPDEGIGVFYLSGDDTRIVYQVSYLFNSTTIARSNNTDGSNMIELFRADQGFFTFLGFRGDEQVLYQESTLTGPGRAILANTTTGNTSVILFNNDYNLRLGRGFLTDSMDRLILNGNIAGQQSEGIFLMTPDNPTPTPITEVIQGISGRYDFHRPNDLNFTVRFHQSPPADGPPSNSLDYRLYRGYTDGREAIRVDQ